MYFRQCHDLKIIVKNCIAFHYIGQDGSHGAINNHCELRAPSEWTIVQIFISIRDDVCHHAERGLGQNSFGIYLSYHLFIGKFAHESLDVGLECGLELLQVIIGEILTSHWNKQTHVAPRPRYMCQWQLPNCGRYNVVRCRIAPTLQ